MGKDRNLEIKSTALTARQMVINAINTFISYLQGKNGNRRWLLKQQETNTRQSATKKKKSNCCCTYAVKSGYSTTSKVSHESWFSSHQAICCAPLMLLSDVGHICKDHRESDRKHTRHGDHCKVPPVGSDRENEKISRKMQKNKHLVVVNI